MKVTRKEFVRSVDKEDESNAECWHGNDRSIDRSELWKNNVLCPRCGEKADSEIFSCETGYDYCSAECARKHVKQMEPEGGY